MSNHSNAFISADELPIPTHIFPLLDDNILYSQYHLPDDLLTVERAQLCVTAEVLFSAIKLPPDKVVMAQLSVGFQVAYVILLAFDDIIQGLNIML